MYAFIFCPLWGTKNTLFSAPSVKRGGERHIRGCSRGGLVVARLGPLLFLAWLIRRRIQSWARVLGASGRGSVVSSMSALYLTNHQEVGTPGWLALFSCLRSRRRPGATGSSRRAGVLREEVLHRLSLRETFSKALPTAGPNRLPDENGASRKETLSVISVIMNQRWHSNTTWAVAVVARRARSVTLFRSLSEDASRPASSLASILAWKT